MDKAVIKEIIEEARRSIQERETRLQEYEVEEAELYSKIEAALPTNMREVFEEYRELRKAMSATFFGSGHYAGVCETVELAFEFVPSLRRMFNHVE